MNDSTDQNGSGQDGAGVASNGKSAYVDEDTCIGCTLCTQFAPETFSMKDNGKSRADGAHTDPVDAIQSSIDACPVQCISWKDRD